jgi:FkbM family methyltransferase
MDLGIFHEIWDHERYTAGPIGEIARGGIVVDIGAHVGLFSVYTSRILKARRIVSVEPDASNFDLLSKNIHVNHIENATVVEAAVAGESGEKWISINPSNTGGHSLYRHGPHARLVRVLSLMDLFESSGISECSLLKIDCEGAEMEIFKTAPDGLLKRVSAISLEYHLDTYPPEKLEMFRTRIERLGFVVEVRPTNKTLGILRGIQRS